VLLAGSLALSAVLFLAGFPFFFMFLFIPLIPFFGSSGRAKVCPVCGRTTFGSEKFCPYDGTKLKEKR